MDMKRRAVIQMLERATLKPAFKIIVYGWTARQLLTVPNPVIQGMAERYPEHISTMMHVEGDETLFHKLPSPTIAVNEFAFHPAIR